MLKPRLELIILALYKPLASASYHQLDGIESLYFLSVLPKKLDFTILLMRTHDSKRALYMRSLLASGLFLNLLALFEPVLLQRSYRQSYHSSVNYGTTVGSLVLVIPENQKISAKCATGTFMVFIFFHQLERFACVLPAWKLFRQLESFASALRYYRETKRSSSDHLNSLLVFLTNIHKHTFFSARWLHRAVGPAELNVDGFL